MTMTFVGADKNFPEITDLSVGSDWGAQDALTRAKMTARRRPSESSTSTSSSEQDDGGGAEAVMEEKIGLALMRLDKEKLRREAEREKNQRQKREQELRWHSRILEAAFDGDLPEIVAVLKELSDRETSDHVAEDDVGILIRQRHQRELVNCCDANDNTPLSEAAAGGHVDTVRYLLQKGSDVNTIGLFKRTPLYRAAFCGHLQVCQILLSNGADPRIYAEDGQTPEMVTTVPSIKSLLHNWDLSLTDEMLDTIGQSESMYDDRQEKLKLNEAERLRQQYRRTQRDWDRLSQDVYSRVATVKEKLAVKRQNENDRPTNSMLFDKLLEEVRVAEQREEDCRLKLEELRHKFSALHLQTPVDIDDDSKPGLKIQIRDLDEVLIMDSEDKIASSGKWPLVIDSTDQTSIFLRYCDTNYLDAYQPRNMEPHTIRLAILGGIRYGKPVVVDLHGTDMFDAVTMKFDKVIPGLMDLLLSKQILRNERYLALVKESDGPEYDKSQFTMERILRFKLIFLTQMANPPDTLVNRTFLLRIVGSSGRPSDPSRRANFRSCGAGVCVTRGSTSRHS